MEVKVMLGRHIWDFAQHADWLGKRTFELRQPEHYTRRPDDGYVGLLEQMKNAETVSERLTLLYDVVLTGLVRRYDRYLEATDKLLDGPSALIIERIIPELRRQMGEAQNLRKELAVKTAD